jgi:hypothetical protein
MNNMFEYIFGSMDKSEAALQKIHKALKVQDVINRRFVCFTFVTAVYVVVMGMHIQEQNEKIKKLSDEVEKLKESAESDS